MAATLATDQFMIELLEPLKSHKSAHSVTNYRTMSGNFSWSKPVMAMISAAVAQPDEREPTHLMDEFLA